MASIFVSSTFKDMQAERDMIRDRVLPAVNDFAYSRGAHVDMIDLRWGIDTGHLSEEESGIKVLRTCFDEIDRSRPFLLVLLGGRYGWVPGLDVLQASIADLAFVPDASPQSVTALEIAYGAMSPDKEPPQVFFYFREGVPADSLPPAQRPLHFDAGENAERLQTLKQSIRAAHPDRIRTYTPQWQTDGFSGLEPLAAQMIEDVLGILSQQLPEAAPDSWQAEERLLQQRYAAARLRRFQGREALLGELRERVGHGGLRLMLTGGSGTGKSALLCKAALQFEEDGALVLPFHCGLSPRTSLVENLLRMGIWQLTSLPELAGRMELPDSPDASIAAGASDAADVSHATDTSNALDTFIAADVPNPSDLADTFEELRRRFFHLLSRASASRRVVLVVDALNQLSPCPQSERLLWLRGLPADISVLCSITDGPELPAFQALGGETRALPPLEAQETASVMDRLIQSHHKELDPRVRNAILLKRAPAGDSAAANPLYLQLIIHELVMMNRYDHAQMDALTAAGMNPEDAIATYMTDLVEASDGTPDGEYLTYLTRISTLFGTKPFFTVVLALASSRHGLREEDLENLFRRTGMSWNASDFAWIRQLLREHLAQGDMGQWEFTHGLLRDALLQSADPDKMEWINCHLSLALFDGADRFCARERMHHLWLARLPEVAAMAIANSDSHWDTEYAEGLSQIWNLRHSEWARLLARGEPGNGQDGTPEDFVIALLQNTGDLAHAAHVRLARFVCEHLLDALHVSFPAGQRIRLLTETLTMLRACGTSDVETRATESLLLMYLGLLYTGTGNKEAARSCLDEAEIYAKVLHQRDPTTHRVLLASIRSAFGDYLLADLKDLKAVGAFEKALEPLTTDNPETAPYGLAPHELAVRAAIHAKLSAARIRLGQHTPHAESHAQAGLDDLSDAGLDEAATEPEAVLRLAFTYLQKADAMEDPAQALPWMKQAHELLRGAHERSASPESLRGLVVVLLKHGMLQERLESQEEGLDTPAGDLYAQGARLAGVLFAQTGQPMDELYLANALFRQADHLLQEEDKDQLLPLLQQSYEHALSAHEQTGSPESGHQACDAAEYLALLLPALNRRPEARPYLEKRVEIMDTLYRACATGTEVSGGDFPRIQQGLLEALTDLGQYLADGDNPREAYQALEMGLAFHEMFYEDSCADMDETTGDDGDDEDDRDDTNDGDDRDDGDDEEDGETGASGLSGNLRQTVQYYEALRLLADTMTAAGDAKDAQEHYFRMGEIAAALFNRTHDAQALLLYARALGDLADNEARLGDWEESSGHFSEMERAYGTLIQQANSEEVLASFAFSMRLYGTWLLRMDDREAAKHAFGQAGNAFATLEKHIPGKYDGLASELTSMI